MSRVLFFPLLFFFLLFSTRCQVIYIFFRAWSIFFSRSFLRASIMVSNRWDSIDSEHAAGKNNAAWIFSRQRHTSRTCRGTVINLLTEGPERVRMNPRARPFNCFVKYKFHVFRTEGEGIEWRTKMKQVLGISSDVIAITALFSPFSFLVQFSQTFPLFFTTVPIEIMNISREFSNFPSAFCPAIIFSKKKKKIRDFRFSQTEQLFDFEFYLNLIRNCAIWLHITL